MNGNSIRPLIGRRHILGHDAIDEDHFAIADGWLRAVNCEQMQFLFFIARLRKLMRLHFDREAALMHSSGGMLCKCHQSEHLTLLDLCDQAAALSTTNWRRTQSLLRIKFPKLIREHINGMDQIAVLFINSNMKAASGQ